MRQQKKRDMKQWVRDAQEVEERFCGGGGGERGKGGVVEEVVGRFVGEVFGEGEGLIGLVFFFFFTICYYLFLCYIPIFIVYYYFSISFSHCF